MKKTTLIAYTLVVLMIGAMVGGAVSAWAASRAARVQLGSNQVGMYYESDTSVIVTIYRPNITTGTEGMGPGRLRILLKPE